MLLHSLTSLARCQNYKSYLVPLLRCALRVWTRNDENDKEALKEGYKRHNQHIRDIVPKNRLLVFDPKDGWEPLCDFLDKDVPNEPFPLLDEAKVATQLHKSVFVRMWALASLQNLVKRLIPLLLVVAVLYRLLKND